MADKELRKMRRSELIELIFAMKQEITRLTEKCSSLEQQVHNRLITSHQCGSIAEASLRLNKVFEAAQQAADDYVASVMAMSGEEGVQDLANEEVSRARSSVAEAKIKAHGIINDAEVRAREIIAEAQKQAEAIQNDAQAQNGFMFTPPSSAMLPVVPPDDGPKPEDDIKAVES